MRQLMKHLIKTLQDNGVEITAAPPEQPAWWMSLLGSAIRLSSW